MDQTDGHYITQYPADQIGYNLGINNFPFPLGKLVTFTEEMANWLYERDEAVSGCKTVNRSNDDLIGKTGYFYINHDVIAHQNNISLKNKIKKKSRINILLFVYSYLW